MHFRNVYCGLLPVVCDVRVVTQDVVVDMAHNIPYDLCGNARRNGVRYKRVAKRMQVPLQTERLELTLQVFEFAKATEPK